MPTGYTANIENGEYDTFEEYAVQCMRNFGACIMQRDDEMSDEPKLREVSPYYKDSVDEETKTLDELRNLTNEEIINKFNLYVESQRKICEDGIQKNKDLVKRYNQFLEWSNGFVNSRVFDKGYDGYNNFIVKQIEDSIKFDCNSSYYENLLNSVNKLTYKDWYEDTLEYTKESLNRSKLRYQEELDRCKGSNEWITELITAIKEYQGELDNRRI